jgi:hypothetical protein
MHRPTIHWLLRVSSVLVLFIGMVCPAPACTIPVFRYALERWELSPYELVVFQRGDLSADPRAALDSLPQSANLIVTFVDLDGKLSQPLREMWERQGKSATLPWLVLRRPGNKADIWAGPLTPSVAPQIIDSPVRQRIVSALSQGDAGVFVLLLSGNRDADAAAEALLRRELAKLEKLVKLPEQRGDGPRIRLALPLKVSFTVLPLQRNAPGEDMLVHLLLGSEVGLSKVTGPIVFPVFGRGRVLGSMYGKDLAADNPFYDVVSFLCGECSCQVKELNPGIDLPIAADWTAIFARIGPAPDSGPETPLGATRNAARAKPLAGLLPVAPGTLKPGADEVRVALSYYPPLPEAAESVGPCTMPLESLYRRWLWNATIAAGLLVLVTGAWACVHWRRGKSA